MAAGILGIQVGFAVLGVNLIGAIAGSDGSGLTVLP